MIRRFNDEKPIEGRAYDVFSRNGDYLGYLDYIDSVTPGWYSDNTDFPIDTAGTYYSDDHDDWLLMLETMIVAQERRCD